jgi:hypothetical protein
MDQLIRFAAGVTVGPALASDSPYPHSARLTSLGFAVVGGL